MIYDKQKKNNENIKNRYLMEFDGLDMEIKISHILTCVYGTYLHTY